MSLSWEPPPGDIRISDKYRIVMLPAAKMFTRLPANAHLLLMCILVPRQHSRASNNIYNGCLVSPRYHQLSPAHLIFTLSSSHFTLGWSVRPEYWLGQICGLILVIVCSLYLSWEEWSALNCPVNQILIIAVFVFTSQKRGGGLGVSSWDIFVCNQSSDLSNEWEDELSWRCKISQSVSWETQQSFVDWLAALDWRLISGLFCFSIRS